MRIFEHINMSLLVTCLCAILDIGKHIKERQKHETMGGTIYKFKSSGLNAARHTSQAYKAFVNAAGGAELPNPAKSCITKTALTPNNITDHSISLNPANLEYLCQECHNIEHYQKFGSTRRGLAFDANGQLVQVSDEANNGEA